MIRLYDTKKRAWTLITPLRWALYRLVRSKRYVTAIMGEHGYDFTGANKIDVIDYK